MSKSRELIRKHNEKFPEHEYYSGLLETAQNNINSNPDTCIETCKSVLEGLAKTVLDKTGIEYSTRGRNPDSPPKLFRMAVEELCRGTDTDPAFLLATHNVVVRVVELRNERGDISKGRAVPKVTESDSELAHFVYEVTDSICVYFLSKYFAFDWSTYEEIKYEDNPDYNEFLDSDIELPPPLLYSKALFDQDSVTYEQGLQNYLLDKETES
jgi:hypothetical protein